MAAPTHRIRTAAIRSRVPSGSTLSSRPRTSVPPSKTFSACGSRILDQVAEIESTSRLRVEKEALYLTAPLIFATGSEPWCSWPRPASCRPRTC